MKLFTDGAYRPAVNENVFGWGFALYDDAGDVVASDAGISNEHIESRQIGGECMAAIKGLRYCLAHEILDVEIVYDYIGVESWATFKFKANKPVSQAYVNDYLALLRDFNTLGDKLGKKVNVRFKKVKGHSGVAGNELADKLASGVIR